MKAIRLLEGVRAFCHTRELFVYVHANWLHTSAVSVGVVALWLTFQLSVWLADEGGCVIVRALSATLGFTLHHPVCLFVCKAPAMVLVQHNCAPGDCGCCCSAGCLVLRLMCVCVHVWAD